MKQNYEKVELEIVKISSEDVIATSGESLEKWGPDI